MSSAWIAVVVTQWVVIALLAFVTIGILRYLAFFRERMELAAPPPTARHIGTSVPELQFLDMFTDSPTQLPNGRSCLLLFVSLTCGGCNELLTQIERVLVAGRKNHDIDIAIAIIDDQPDKFPSAWPVIANASAADVTVLIDANGAAAATLGVWQLPTGLLVDDRGRLADQSFNPHVAGWLYQALKEQSPTGAGISDRAIPVSVPTWLDLEPTAVKKDGAQQ